MPIKNIISYFIAGVVCFIMMPAVAIFIKSIITHEIVWQFEAYSVVNFLIFQIIFLPVIFLNRLKWPKAVLNIILFLIYFVVSFLFLLVGSIYGIAWMKIVIISFIMGSWSVLLSILYGYIIKKLE